MVVSIVIVSCNSGPLLVECVQGALASTVPVEVVVSDNDSADGSVEPLEDMTARNGRLRVIRNNRNLGFAAANNVALAQAGGEFVLFLNPDCLLQPDTVERMVAALNAHPEAGMAGCLIRNPDGTVQEDCLRPMPTPARLLRQLLGKAEQPASGVEAISGAFMLVRRADLERIGSFDEGYFLHWEDLDLCRRFRDAGREILFVPEVEVVHFKGRSSGRRPLWVEWQKHRGLMRFLRKFHFSGGLALIYPMVALAIALRFLLQVLRSRLRAPATETAASMGAEEGREIWVFGATSLVGRHLLPRLIAAGWRVRAFCTDPGTSGIGVSPRLTLHAHDIRNPASLPAAGRPEALINLAPVFALPPLLPVLGGHGVKSVIAFGSTSAITKADSPIAEERHLAACLTGAEREVHGACESAGMRWVIFRPTMIYSFGHDRNVTRLAGFIRRFGFFPMPGEGRGLRQPVHADDLARACVAMLDAPSGWNQVYDLSGGETLDYRAMVEAIFHKLGRQPRIVRLPDALWRLALGAARLLPAYRDVNPAMLRRVDADMCFSHEAAAGAFGFSPRPFLR